MIGESIRMNYNRSMVSVRTRRRAASRVTAAVIAAMLTNGCGGGFGSPDLGKLTPIGPTPAPIAESQTLSITSENDDGEVYGGNAPGSEVMFDGETNTSDVYVGNNGITPVYGFVRFQLIKAIPSGAVVSNATMTFYGDGDYQWDDANDSLIITANDSANIGPVAVYEDRIGGTNGHTPTNALVAWPSSGPLAWNRAGLNSTPNLKTIIQELVDKHGGLAAGASIQFWMFGPPVIGDSEIRFADYGHPQHATSLVINWEK